jgi:voltage-dependent calcium channel alpha-2/delta-4
MRHYPALSWDRNETDTYDCRKRSWYIETATCSKDVIILLDQSGSMTGYRYYVAKLTLEYLLDTLSNNDFVSVITYNDKLQALVPCFNTSLVQATKENIKVFVEHSKNIGMEEAPDTEKLQNYANVTEALKLAFKILGKYRDVRNCSGSETGCNQAIMLITDGVEKNASDIFEEYNYMNSNITSPVRVFSYLLGKEVTKVKEFQNYACLNRGYYSHIQSLDEVAEGVLQYVNVIAAPLVLQKEEKPPTWTHTYVDDTNTFDEEKVKDNENDFRLIISVGVPAFNLSSYSDGNYTGRPSLLGVAGTDIPIDDIKKLALPYKLGVNGYSFMVSNNGYILLHPDLRPYDKVLKKSLVNYNSIDFTEIEFVDYEEYNVTSKNMTLQRKAKNFDKDDPLILKYPRVPSVVMEEMRANLVDGKTGSLLNVSVLFDYDDLRRIEKSRQDYYYAPIPYTPFSLGIGKCLFNYHKIN